MALTFVLLGFIVLLVLADAIISLLPRKEKDGKITVSFIPPSAAPLHSEFPDSKLDAHISSTNQKISLLFSRMEKVERDVSTLLSHTGLDSSSEKSSDATWLETVPVRNRKR